MALDQFSPLSPRVKSLTRAAVTALLLSACESSPRKDFSAPDCQELHNEWRRGRDGQAQGQKRLSEAYEAGREDKVLNETAGVSSIAGNWFSILQAAGCNVPEPYNEQCPDGFKLTETKGACIPE